MYYIVYKTTNKNSLVNGINKIYIGVHQTENPNIFDGYIGCGCYINRPSTYNNPITPFQYAVKKYGSESFTRETLFIFSSMEEAYKKESELVNIDFIQKPYTYNIAIGGVGGSLYKQLPEWHAKEIYQFDIKGNLIKEWKSTLDASEYYNEPYYKFGWAITDCYLFLNSYWSRSKTININKYSNNHQEITYLYNTDRKMIKIFPSRTECSKELECTPQAISKAIKTKSTIKGFYVSNELLEEFIPVSRVSLKDSIIYVYDKDGSFICKGIGKEIMNFIEMSSTKSIWSAIYSNNGWYKNYYLSLEEINKVPEKLNNRHKKIDIFNLQGELIETLDSLKEVKEKYNLNAAALNRYLKGLKEHEQYKFIYHK